MIRALAWEVGTNIDQKSQEGLFQTLLETAVDGIMVIDDAGCVLVYSPACERLFGYAQDDVIGKNVKMLMPPPYRDEHDHYLDRHLKTGEKRIIGIGREVFGRRKNGTQFPMYLSVGEGWIRDRRIFVGIVADVSERKARDQHINELQNELLHVSRLTAMGQLSSALAHELNQPLAAALNYVSGSRLLIGADNRPDSTEIAAGLDACADQIMRAGQIIRRLRDFVEKREPNRSSEDINSTIEEAVSLAIPPTAEPNIKVMLQLGTELPRMWIDRIQMQQVVVNLVRNAIDAMESSERRELMIRTGTDGLSEVLVAISDSGSGLSPTIASRLFQPFTTNKKGGMGLGLAICRSIVEAHGGQLTAEANAEGDGMTFKFTIPTATTGKR